MLGGGHMPIAHGVLSTWNATLAPLLPIQYLFILQD